MKLNLIAAAVLTAAAFGAHAGIAQISINGGSFAAASQAGTAADPYQFGAVGPAGSAVVRITGSIGSFTNYVSFTLASPFTGVDGSGGSFLISGFNTKMYLGTPLGSNTLLASTNVYSLTGLSAGSYFLKLTGTANAAGSTYLAGVSATPVPEPETYALMAAGLAVIGFVAKRRKSA